MTISEFAFHVVMLAPKQEFAFGICYAIILHLKPDQNPMPASHASYTIEPEVLSRFNAIVPAGERNKIIEACMKKAVKQSEREAAAIAGEFMTNPDFVQARADAAYFAESALTDGLED